MNSQLYRTSWDLKSHTPETNMIIFIPNSRDEELFIQIMNNLPNINLKKHQNKYPFYSLFLDSNILYVRKRNDTGYGARYKRLGNKEIAALALLPLDAYLPYLRSL